MSAGRQTSAQLRRSAMRAGLVSIAAVAAVVYLIFGGPLPLRGGYEVDAILSSASQLHGGSPVRIAGVDVGEVVGVERGPGDTARVRLRIDDHGRPIHRDATLKVRPRLFLEGNFFVDLRPGTPAAPELPEGGTIPLGQTAIPVQLDQVLSTLTADARGELRTLLDEYGRSLDRGGAEALNRVLRAAPGALEGVALAAAQARGLRDGDLRLAVRDGERVLRALASRRKDLASLVTAYRRTTEALGADTGAVAASLRRLAATVREAGPALASVGDALPAARAFSRDLRTVLRPAPQTLDLAQPLVEALDRLLAPGELPALVRHARPLVRDVARLSPDLRALLGKLAPVVTCVRDNVLPTITTAVPDGLHATGLAPWQELLDGVVGLASASQNFDANGTAVRYFGDFGDQMISVGRSAGPDRLYQLSSEPLIGSRPATPARKPPFRPDVPCISQDPPDLRARTAPPPPTRRVQPRRMGARQAGALLRREQRRAQRLRRTLEGRR